MYRKSQNSDKILTFEILDFFTILRNKQNFQNIQLKKNSTFCDCAAFTPDAMRFLGAITCKVNAEMRTDANSLRRRAWSGGRRANHAIEAIEGGVKHESSIFSSRASNSRDAFSRKPISVGIPSDVPLTSCCWSVVKTEEMIVVAVSGFPEIYDTMSYIYRDRNKKVLAWRTIRTQTRRRL